MSIKRNSSTSRLSAKIRNTAIFCWISLLLVGCQSTPLDVQYAKDADFNPDQYQTFAIEPVSYEDNPFVKYVNLGIETVMSEKGYRLSDDPDLIIRYSVIIEEEHELKLDQVPSGTLIHTTPLIEAVFEAKMLVNAIDARSGEVLWKAATSRDISSVNTRKIEQARVNQRIGELFDSFNH